MIAAAIVYAAMSLITFVVYALDKRAAVRGRWRVAESSLHLLALLGGVPGALIAQQVLRHKRRKWSFMAVTAAIALLHAAAWGLWLLWSVSRT